MADKDNHLVIMAGGIGSRFWPMSTVERPKQFVDVLGTGRTLIQLTMDRFEGVVPRENVWIVTSAKYADLVREQLPDVPEGNILKEPCRRNTAPCIAYVSWRIKAQNPKANIVVTPSDHIVLDTQEFRRVIGQSLSFVRESDAIVTLGMKPTRPETGYGYIQVDLADPCTSNKEIFRVDSFHEKPNLEKAKAYLAEKNFFWNAGIFVWNVSTIVNAFRIYAKDISSVFEALLPYYGSAREQMIMPFLRKQKKSIASPPVSVGAISVLGAHLGQTLSVTYMAMHSSAATSVWSIAAIALSIRLTSVVWSSKVSMATSWLRRTAPCSFADSRTNNKSNNIAKNSI